MGGEVGRLFLFARTARIRVKRKRKRTGVSYPGLKCCNWRHVGCIAQDQINAEISGSYISPALTRRFSPHPGLNAVFSRHYCGPALQDAQSDIGGARARASQLVLRISRRHRTAFPKNPGLRVYRTSWKYGRGSALQGKARKNLPLFTQNEFLESSKRAMITTLHIQGSLIHHGSMRSGITSPGIIPIISTLPKL